MPSPLIHSDLSSGDWETTTDPAPVCDPATKLASLRVPLVFKGTRNALLAEFPFGAQNAPNGGQGMFCLGPSDISLVPNCGRDPHWDVTVDWIGLHSGVTGHGQGWIANVLIDWAHRETEFPIEIPQDAGDPYVLRAGPPLAPSGDSETTNPRRARRLDHLPTANILAVIRDPQAIHPQNSKVIAIMNLLKTLNFGSVIFNYNQLTDPTWVTWNTRGAPTTVGATPSNPADWFIRQIQTTRRISAGSEAAADAIHVVQITATLEQLQQPS